MARAPLLATYRQGENRVSASTFAVLQRLETSLVEELLNAAIGDSGAISLLDWELQPSGKGASVPDGLLRAHVAVWWEFKTTRNAYAAPHAQAQYREHLKNVSPTAGDLLLVVTPDPVLPAFLAENARPDVLWFNYASLHDAITEVLDAPRELGDRTRFLLRELQDMYILDGLVGSDDVVVVAARTAYQVYLDASAYGCQVGRAVKDGVTHIAFYQGGAIRPEVAKILGFRDNVAYVPGLWDEGSELDEEDPVVSAAVRRLMSSGHRPPEHGPNKVFALSAPDDPLTVQLPSAIANGEQSRNGAPTAYTMGQRYTRLALLQEAAAAGRNTTALR